ncbi:hypothetical protein I302_104623 [Kwoniella bestiolae CBS 10118]|uniref:Uncharacterized protein n=1 Tax=Kwoniella bestiolae CBS 10118 TaxID=1296100 RepID=A0A1B9GBS6_9TREE|nr:hypothetical protein I302_03331 [Kwoniella bestiolae CBS 10118]OCF28472.1 hypothetical protein I302_03331 [Kwoniella bestiolae CBS 10118]
MNSPALTSTKGPSEGRSSAKSWLSSWSDQERTDLRKILLEKFDDLGTKSVAAHIKTLGLKCSQVDSSTVRSSVVSDDQAADEIKALETEANEHGKHATEVQELVNSAVDSTAISLGGIEGNHNEILEAIRDLDLSAEMTKDGTVKMKVRSPAMRRALIAGKISVPTLSVGIVSPTSLWSSRQSSKLTKLVYESEKSQIPAKARDLVKEALSQLTQDSTSLRAASKERWLRESRLKNLTVSAQDERYQALFPHEREYWKIWGTKDWKRMGESVPEKLYDDMKERLHNALRHSRMLNKLRANSMGELAVETYVCPTLDPSESLLDEDSIWVTVSGDNFFNELERKPTYSLGKYRDFNNRKFDRKREEAA